MKVYVVTEGEYSDYHIEEIFGKQEDAIKFIENNKSDYYLPTVEEYEVSETPFPKRREPCFYYEHPLEKEFDKNLVSISSRAYRAAFLIKQYYTDIGNRGEDTVCCYLSERNDEKAYKILQDELAFVKAVKAGIV